MTDKYVWYFYSASKSFGNEPYFLHRDEIPNTGFSSLYAVTEETARGLCEAGHTRGFKGCVWSERISLDFDSYEAATRAQLTLEEQGYDYIMYDTGGRGCHIAILRNSEPSHIIPLLDKAWARKAFPECDSSVYSHLHLFRLPGTVHEKTGRPKRKVYEKRGKALVIDRGILNGRTFYNGNGSGVCDNGRSVFDLYHVMKNVRPVSEGKRHASLVSLCYGLKNAGITEVSVIRSWLYETNKLFTEPKEESEIEQIIRSICEVDPEKGKL